MRISDWSSDVCSSDLAGASAGMAGMGDHGAGHFLAASGRRILMRLPLRLVSILAFLALWAAAAGLAGRSEVPGPLAVLTFVVREAADGTLFYHLAVTLARVAAAFLIAMAVGAAIGVAMGQHSRLDRLLDPWIILLIKDRKSTRLNPSH